MRPIEQTRPDPIIAFNKVNCFGCLRQAYYSLATQQGTADTGPVFILSLLTHVDTLLLPLTTPNQWVARLSKQLPTAINKDAIVQGTPWRSFQARRLFTATTRTKPAPVLALSSSSSCTAYGAAAHAC